MKVREVIVIGDGLAGCAVSYELVKRGISVSIIPSQQENKHLFFSLLNRRAIVESFETLKNHENDNCICPRAFENVVSSFQKVHDEWFSSAENGVNIYLSLIEKLKHSSFQVEWLNQHIAIELLTLEKNSNKPVDCYKKPTCCGVKVYCQETQKIEHFLAKEIIIATEGFSSLYLYSTQRGFFGKGGVLAKEAGARLLNIGTSHFHALGLYVSKGICIPLPSDIMFHGARLCISGKEGHDLKEKTNEELLQIMFDELLLNDFSLPRLDVSDLKRDWFNENYSDILSLSKEYGVNFFQDKLLIVPCVISTTGGIVVDKVAQTSLQRLRAIGNDCVTGLFFKEFSPALKVLESLSWSISCAEDISKMIQKFAYYFPEIKDEELTLSLGKNDEFAEEWNILKQLTWMYGGIRSDCNRLRKGNALLNTLYSTLKESPETIEKYNIIEALKAAELIFKGKMCKVCNSPC